MKKLTAIISIFALALLGPVQQSAFAISDGAGSEHFVLGESGDTAGNFYIYDFDTGYGSPHLVVENPTGAVGIGVANPDNNAALHVDGIFRYVDGNESNGFILQTDADGDASWVDPNDIITMPIIPDNDASAYDLTDNGDGREWFAIDTTNGSGNGSIDFGNATDNPLYNFLGTSLTTFGGGIDVSGGDITLENDETISNSVDGTVAITATDTTVSGSFDVQGGDITLQNDETISNSVDGTVAITATDTTVSGSFDVQGGDITLQNDETISNSVDGTVAVTAASTTFSGDATVTGADLTIGAPTVADNGAIVMHDNQAGDSFSMTLAAAADIDADFVLTFPADDGDSNQVLTTDGSGGLSWSSLTMPIIPDNDGASYDLTDDGDGREWLAIDTTNGSGNGSIDFGNATDNPLYNFLGTSLTTFGGGIDVSGGDITLQNDETISNSVDGTVAITATDTTVSGSFDVQGGDITLQNDETISNSVDGTVAITATDTTVSGSFDVQGGDITLQNDETISNSVDGTVAVTAASTTFSGDATVTGADLTIGAPTVADNGAIVMHDNQAGDSFSMTLAAAADIDADFVLTFPADDGDSNQVLTTDGSGGLSWSSLTMPIIPDNDGASYDLTDDGDGREWLAIDTTNGSGNGSIDFGNATDNPLYNFLGTSLTTFGGGIDVSGGDITLQNDETISNSVDGTVAITATDTTVSGSFDVQGGDITLQNDETISNSVDGTVAITATDTTVSGSFDVQGGDITLQNDETISNSVDGTVAVTAASTTFSGDATVTGADLTIGAPTVADNGAIVMHDNQAGDSFSMTLAAAADIDADFVLTFPADDGDSNQVLTTDGSGGLSWSSLTMPIIPDNDGASYDLTDDGDGREWLAIDTTNGSGNGSIDFGNATDNPLYNFLGTSLTTFGGGIDVSGGDITLQNDETISNSVDGTVAITATDTTVSGSFDVQGGDITLQNDETISNSVDGTVAITATDTTVSGSFDVQGGDITLQNDETISNSVDGTVAVTAASTTFSGDATVTGADLTIGAPTVADNGAIVMHDNQAGDSFSMTLAAAADIDADFVLTFPADDGDSNQVLTTDGSGGLSWSSLTMPIIPDNDGASYDLTDDGDGREWLAIDTTNGSGNGSIDFGNATDNPLYNFLGTSLTTFGGGIDVSGGDITLQNDETISNSVDGTVAITATDTTLSGSLDVQGGDITLENDEVITNGTDGTIGFTDGTNTLADIEDRGTTGRLNVNGSISATPIADAVSTGNNITPDSSVVTISAAAAAIEVGIDTTDVNPGQMLILIGTGANTMRIEDNDNHAGTNVQLSRNINFRMGAGDTLHLVYDDTTSMWREVRRSNN